MTLAATTVLEMAVPMAKGQATEGEVVKDGRGSAAGKSYGGHAGIGAGRGTACGPLTTITKRIPNPPGRGVGGGVACGNDELGNGLAKGAGVGNGKG